MNIDFEEYFNEENIEDIREEMEEYLYDLYAQPLYINNSEKQFKLYDDIFLNTNANIQSMLNLYENLLYEETLMENWLAYQIGFQKGLEQEKNSR